MSTKIRMAEPQDREILETLDGFDTSSVPEDYFDVHFTDTNKYTVCIAEEGGAVAGFCFYNRSPKYALFNKLDIPEIQDLFVCPRYRQQGIGSALIDYCEELARKEKASHLGVGVGVHTDFGNAQRLYVKKGFEPDGQGAVYDRKTVTPMEVWPVDDDLCLMLIKKL